MSGLSYRDAGVDIDAGDELVRRIKPLAERTRIAEQLGGIGGFAGLCGLPAGLKEPVLVSGTDGVGTKLKVAFLADRHDTVGIDLVAMCVNDVITCIAKGCEDAGCALLGGETAEMPGMYTAGEYDLAGFSVGVVDREKIIDGTKVRPGDAVSGVASSGLHSNGYSLGRKVLFEKAGLALDARPSGLGEPLVD